MLISVSRDFFGERLQNVQTRIATTLERLSDEDINWRPNAESNSIANLVVHLKGNFHERLEATMAGQANRRLRNQEFDETLYRNQQELIRIWHEVCKNNQKFVNKLTTNMLSSLYPLRNHQIKGDELLLRVLTHAAEHTGQILYIAKLRKAQDWQILSIPKPQKK